MGPFIYSAKYLFMSLQFRTLLISALNFKYVLKYSSKYRCFLKLGLLFVYHAIFFLQLLLNNCFIYLKICRNGNIKLKKKKSFEPFFFPNNNKKNLVLLTSKARCSLLVLSTLSCICSLKFNARKSNQVIHKV